MGLKKIAILLIIFLNLSIAFAHGQETKEVCDTIFMLSGEEIPCTIRMVTTSQVKYVPLKKEKQESAYRKHIEYVVYKTGRTERFNKPILMMLEEGDYKTVILSENENDAAGMYVVGDVKGKSIKGARSMRQAQKNAEIRMQKAAAKIGGTIVIITKREAKGGYGEIPSYFLEGTAYSYNPPPKKEEKENK
jgi:hypothetical protein